jgi:hypothetical protein
VDFNEDVIVPLIVGACIVMALAMRSFRRNARINSYNSVWHRREGRQYGTWGSTHSGMKKPWFSTPFFIAFCVAAVLVWLVFA